MATVPNALSSLESILNTSRAVANDSYNAGAGEILTDTAPFTLPYINSSLQELQDRLRNNAVVVLTVDNYIISGLEVVPVDPSLQTFIDATGYYSLNSTGVPVLLDAALTLPIDITAPKFLWERPTGSNLPFVPMSQPTDGLVSYSQGPALGNWEWRSSPNGGTAIWFRGATQVRDIRIRYQKAEAVVPAGSNYANIIVDLPGAANALSYLIAFRYVMSRNPETAPIVRAEADRHIREIIKTAVRQKQGTNYTRPAYGGQQHGNSNRIL
jgi:hypothetical protein